MTDMRRREFITLVAGGLAVWPLAARAQQSGKVSRIGFLGAASASGYARQVEGFRSGLHELGYIEGINIVIAYRWAEGNYARLPELAAELIRSNVDVIVTHGTPGTLAAKQATVTVPIVMAIIGDPVGTGIVASLAHPGGNVTGTSFFGPELGAKRIELLKEMLPRITRVGVLVNPDNPYFRLELPALETAARLLGVEVSRFPVRSPSEFERAFEKMQQEDVKAVAVQDEGMLTANVTAIAALAPKPADIPIEQAIFSRSFAAQQFSWTRFSKAPSPRIFRSSKPQDSILFSISKWPGRWVSMCPHRCCCAPTR